MHCTWRHTAKSKKPQKPSITRKSDKHVLEASSTQQGSKNGSVRASVAITWDCRNGYRIYLGPLELQATSGARYWGFQNITEPSGNKQTNQRPYKPTITSPFCCSLSSKNVRNSIPTFGFSFLSFFC